MKAIVYTQYGSPDVLQFKEVAKPTPKDNEVLIKVYASSVNAAEPYLIKGEPVFVRFMTGGILKPKYTIPGADVTGVVEAVGRNVTQFKSGDEVFGDLSESGWGAFAEYVCADEKALALKPANITFEQAASVPLAGVTAFQGLKKGQIQAGQKVLVNGASGGVGTFAVQIAKSFGAEVTAVCSTKKLDMVRSIGADHVIDYTKEDFTRNGQRYDLIVAANGSHTLSEYRRALSPKGICIVTGGSMTQIFQSMILGPLVSMRGSQKVGNLMAKPSAKDLTSLGKLLEAGKVVPVIDRCYPLSETANALRALQEGRAQGKIVISIENASK